MNKINEGVNTNESTILLGSGVRRNFLWGGFIQWHMVDICIWCALFVTSQFDVIVKFPKQSFGEFC